MLSPNTFPLPCIYEHMNYLFWRRKNIENTDLDTKPYPWIIWYVWKVRNDKLFRGMDRDLLKLIRYAEGECQTWFSVDGSTPLPPHELPLEEK